MSDHNDSLDERIPPSDFGSIWVDQQIEKQRRMRDTSGLPLSRKPKESFNMFRLLAALGGAVAILFVLATPALFHSETVEPGHHGVIVDKPYFFGDSGVRPEPFEEGRKILWRTSSMVSVRMTPQSIGVKVDDFASADGVLLDFESTIQFRVTDSVTLINKFGDGWFDNNIRQQYLAIVRNAIKPRTMSNMMTDVKTAQDVDDEITKNLKDLVTGANLPIEILGVSLGRAKPNDEVMKQVNETAAQEQRKRTLIAAEQAEIQRKREQEARAIADNAYRDKLGMNADQFVKLEAAKIWAEACVKAAHCIVNPNGQVLNVGK